MNHEDFPRLFVPLGASARAAARAGVGDALGQDGVRKPCVGGSRGESVMLAVGQVGAPHLASRLLGRFPCRLPHDYRRLYHPRRSSTSNPLSSCPLSRQLLSRRHLDLGRPTRGRDKPDVRIQFAPPSRTSSSNHLIPAGTRSAIARLCLHRKSVRLRPDRTLLVVRCLQGRFECETN